MGRKPTSIEYRNELRERILIASGSMFREKGFRAVKMDDIAQILGISKRTLYEIFPNKEDLVFEAFKRGVGHMQNRLSQQISESSDTMDILVEYFRLRVAETENLNPALIYDIHSYPRICEYFEQYKETNAKIAIDFLKRGQDEGYFRDDINFDIISIIHKSISDSISTNKAYRQFPPLELLKTMVLIFARGLCTQKGAARIDEMFASLKSS